MIGLAISLITIIGCVIILSLPVKKKNSLSFDKSFDISGLPIVTFICNDKKLSLMIDSGSNVNYLKRSSAEKLKIEISETDKYTAGCNGSVNKTDVCHIKFSDGILFYEDEFYVSEFEGLDSIYECTGYKVDGMIGNTFLEKYKCVLDFNQYKLITNGNI